MLEQTSTETGYLPIEAYGMIGDLTTVALVGRNGSIDWCCLPDFDSPSVFGALLDANKGGSFRLAPDGQKVFSTKQLYFPDTNILVTRFLTQDSIGEITDFMPIKQKDTPRHEHHLVRAVHIVHGALTFQVDCRPAFNYARDSHSSKKHSVLLTACFSGSATSVEARGSPTNPTGRRGGLRPPQHSASIARAA